MAGLSAGQRKLILIGAGIALVIVSYFLIFQRNMQKSSTLEAETKQLNGEIERLSQLQVEVNQMRDEATTQQEVVNEFTYSFPCKIPEESAIYNVYRMMVKSNITVSNITTGTEQVFVMDGKFVPFDSRDYTGVNIPVIDESADPRAVEADPQTRVPLNEMVGKTVGYTIQLSGTQKQIFKAINWVEDNEYPMSVTNLALSYDSSSGNLTGTMQVFFHALNGNGMVYDDPVDVEDFDIGTDSVFGILKKSDKD